MRFQQVLALLCRSSKIVLLSSCNSFINLSNTQLFDTIQMLMSVLEIIHVNTTASTLLVAMSVPVKWDMHYKTIESTAQVCINCIMKEVRNV